MGLCANNDPLEARAEDLFSYRSGALMQMPSTIEKAILAEAEKLIRRHEMYATNLARELRRRELRSGIQPTKTILVPEYWSIANGFNPYYVRKHVRAIARSLERHLLGTC